jgi:hypothetical protein
LAVAAVALVSAQSKTAETEHRVAVQRQPEHLLEQVAPDQLGTMAATERLPTEQAAVAVLAGLVELSPPQRQIESAGPGSRPRSLALPRHSQKVVVSMQREWGRIPIMGTVATAFTAE